jgi:drug/metabolite transporter (DMT)-like permease
MSAVVVPAYLLFGRQGPSLGTNWGPVVWLSLMTCFSRLALFLGIKRIGGMQTALLGLAELLITLSFSHLWLHEQLLWSQWVGAVILSASLLLVKFEKPNIAHRMSKTGWFAWIRPPEMPTDVPWGPHE